MIERTYNLKKLIRAGLVLVIYGPRRVGKTTLLNRDYQNDGIEFFTPDDFSQQLACINRPAAPNKIVV